MPTQNYKLSEEAAEDVRTRIRPAIVLLLNYIYLLAIILFMLYTLGYG